MEWLGPFAAWWALVIDRPATLQQLANALPMMAPAALTSWWQTTRSVIAALSLLRIASGVPAGAIMVPQALLS